jgi:prepilin-type N-terminal cleavage/methylation domain-containing protein
MHPLSEHKITSDNQEKEPKTKRFCRPGRTGRLARAFTLIETMIAIAILGVGSAVLFNTLRASLVLSAKNISLNEGNTSLQKSYNRLLSSLESAALLVDCANYSPSTGTFTAVSSGTWGNSVRFMRLLPITCYVVPMDGSGYSVSNPPPPTRTVSLPASGQFVFLYLNPALYSASVVPASARLYPTFPSVSQTVSTGSSPGVKPGLSFDVFSATPGLIGLHLPTPLGSNAFLDCNRAYFIVESAYAVTQSNVDGHKELLYFADTSQTSNSVVICSRLDGLNQTQAGDSSIPNGGTSGTFSMPAGANAVQTLLPIRSLEYFNTMSRSGGAAARNNTWINVNSKFRLRETL